MTDMEKIVLKSLARQYPSIASASTEIINLQSILNLPKGTEVLISFGEHLDDLRVRSAVGPRNFTMRYVAKEGENNFF